VPPVIEDRGPRGLLGPRPAGRISSAAVNYHYGFKGGLTVGEPRVDTGHLDNTNRANLKKTRGKNTVKYIAVRGLVLVGDGHKKEHIDMVNKARKDLQSTGTIRFNRPILGAGDLIATGVKDKSEFESYLRRLTEKKIKFE
jgi:hypothetical protein